MDIVLRNVDELIKYKKNARVHSSEQISQIADSIKNFGFNDPIEIDKNNILISGHARLEAAKKLGITKWDKKQLRKIDKAYSGVSDVYG